MNRRIEAIDRAAAKLDLIAGDLVFLRDGSQFSDDDAADLAVEFRTKLNDILVWFSDVRFHDTQRKVRAEWEAAIRRPRPADPC